MNIPIDSLPEKSPNINNSGKTTKQHSFNNISFSSQLSGIVNERKKTDKNSIVNDTLSGSLPLKDDAATAINSLLNNNAALNEKSAAKLASLLDKTRLQLMSGIKKSIGKIEESINENEFIDADLKDDYVKLISSLKDDFSNGFGIDYNSFTPANSDNIDSLTKDIENELKLLPQSIRKAIEEKLA